MKIQDAAKARGLKFGRPPCFLPDNIEEILVKVEAKGVPFVKMLPCISKISGFCIS